MKAIMKLAIVGALAMGGVSLAQAQDTSVTVNVRAAIQPTGLSPQVGIVRATSTVGSGQSYTFAIPVPRTTSEILDAVCTTYNVSNSIVPRVITRSANVVTVTGSNGTSGTLAVGDITRCIVVYNP